MSVYSPWHVKGLVCRTRQLTNRRARLIAARSMSKGRERRRANENAPHHVSAGRRGRCDGDRHRAECFGGTEWAALLRRGGIDQLSKTGQRAGLHLASRLGCGFPHSNNPKWRGLGYNARWPVLGHNPKWQAFGYDPKYSGFQPRPSVLRAPQLPVSLDLRCPARSASACIPRIPNAIDTGGSTTYQTPGNAQLTAQIGLAAQQATQPQYPSLAGTTTDTGGLTMYQTPGNAQITARPGPAARDAAQQATSFSGSDLPRA